MLISKIIYAIDAFTDYYFKKRVYIFIHPFTINIIKIDEKSSASAIRTQIKTVSLNTSDFDSFSA